MKSKKKGFTLIELLAVIVILGVLLAIAVPSVAKYLSESKKRTYVSNAMTYATTAKDQASLGTFHNPINQNEATVIFFSAIKEYMEKGGKTSPYGTAYVSDNSFVIIANVGTAEEPSYEYFIAAIDEDGYGLGTSDDSGAKAAAISYDTLSMGNILQLDSGMSKPTSSTQDLKVKSDKKNSELTLEVTKVYPEEP